MDAPLEWQLARVADIRAETSQVKSITLELPRWMRHRPGQHYDIRLTAPDGYQAERSYSIASEPERQGVIDLTVEKIDDGEVSPYLHDVLEVGDAFEVRGPIGGYFVWEAEPEPPTLLVGGGSGVVPLMAMVRHRAAISSPVRTTLLYSCRTRDDIIYRAELEKLESCMDGFECVYTLTREQPEGWTGYARRVDREMLIEVMRPLGRLPRSFVCGPTALVEAVAEALVGNGSRPADVRTERFGPTGT